MTEQERLSRETLLKRAAAVAGAVYVAPVLASSAAAEADACLGQKCAPGKKKGKKKCRKAGGKTCCCINGVCMSGGRCHGGGGCPPCQHGGIGCDAVQACGNCGDGACFHAAGQDCYSANVPGVCISLGSGLCADYTPCENGQCPAGQCCFSSCCDCVQGFPTLCGASCSGSGPASRRSSAPKAGSGPRPYL